MKITKELLIEIQDKAIKTYQAKSGSERKNYDYICIMEGGDGIILMDVYSDGEKDRYYVPIEDINIPVKQLQERRERLIKEQEERKKKEEEERHKNGKIYRKQQYLLLKKEFENE